MDIYLAIDLLVFDVFVVVEHCDVQSFMAVDRSCYWPIKRLQNEILYLYNADGECAIQKYN